MKAGPIGTRINQRWVVVSEAGKKQHWIIILELGELAQWKCLIRSGARVPTGFFIWFFKEWEGEWQITGKKERKIGKK